MAEAGLGAPDAGVGRTLATYPRARSRSAASSDTALRGDAVGCADRMASILADMPRATPACAETRSRFSSESAIRSYTSVVDPARIVIHRPSVSACSGLHPATAG